MTRPRPSYCPRRMARAELETQSFGDGVPIDHRVAILQGSWVTARAKRPYPGGGSTFGGSIGGRPGASGSQVTVILTLSDLRLSGSTISRYSCI